MLTAYVLVLMASGRRINDSNMAFGQDKKKHSMGRDFPGNKTFFFFFLHLPFGTLVSRSYPCNIIPYRSIFVELIGFSVH